jgi:sensor histidine kinase YesM
MLDPLGNYVGIYSEEIPIAFYVNHINLTFCEKNGEPIINDIENHLWFGKSVCCESWVAHSFTQGNTDPIEITVHNPHKFGNENAIDEMLSSVAIWGDMSFERDVEATGDTQRTAGILLMVVSFLFLGTALFSTLIHIKNSKIIWMLGALVLFAGLYFAYGADGVSFWSNSFVLNTAILGFSMMFYMLFLSLIIVSVLKETKIACNIAVIALSVSNALFFVLPLITDILFYDTWLWWVVIQIIINVAFAICLLKEFISSNEKSRWIYLGALLPLIAFEVDAIGTWRGAWRGGVSSQYVFIILFIVAVVMILKYIPQNINAAARAKELEMERIALDAELTESRMSTMMSQIRPHFIYNTLGSIEQLCDIDPKKAGELVHDFAKYLRGNFGELDNPKPILMSKEMEHVHHYVSIENVRFPDMTFTFEMNSDDFKIPALTVQPIVENAIKHGLMKLQKGGTIKVVSYETDTHYCISVVDDGVGFDASVMHDERKHVGLRNIRERLKSMVGGTLEIESTLGVGTKALVKIPKETK